MGITAYKQAENRVSEFAQPDSRLAKATTRLMVDLMFSRKKDIIFFGSGAVASDFNIFDASFFCQPTKRKVSL